MLPTNKTEQVPLAKISSEDDLKSLKKACTDKPIIILFWANWDEPSTTLKNMMEEMPKVYQSVRLVYVDCDESELVDTLEIDTVQTLVCIHPEGSDKKQETITGVKPEQLTALIENENSTYKQWFEEEKKRAFRDIEGYIGSYPFFIFLKGSKEEPKCKFTRRLVEMLGKFGYNYKTFNILADQRIRQWLKVYSSWPTFPQVFINQKFCGGIDVVTELVENEEFDDIVPQSCKPLPPAEQMKKTLEENDLVVFINGSVDEPEDDGSKEMVSKLRDTQVRFAGIDLKKLPEGTAPKDEPFLFFKGVPVCKVNGLAQFFEQPDFLALKEKEKKLSLGATLTNKAIPINQRIEKLLSSSEILLFMKGVPESPECGFSRKMVDLLKNYDGLRYDHFNIFTDNEIREGLKKYSNWPTYPQLYIKGKLIGGIDIIQEMHEENELADVLFPK